MEIIPFGKRCLLAVCFFALILAASPAGAERIFVQTPTAAQSPAPQIQPQAEAHRIEVKPMASQPHDDNVSAPHAMPDALTLMQEGIARELKDSGKVAPSPPPTETKRVDDLPPVQAEADSVVAEAEPNAQIKTHYQFLPLPSSATAEATPLLWPLFLSKPLEKSMPEIHRALIILPDADRNAGARLQAMLGLGGPKVTETIAHTLVLAPMFPATTDLELFADVIKQPQDKIAAWPSKSWYLGGETINGLSKDGVSSFSALDILLLYLSDKTYFPNLQNIVVAGFGSGADMAMRYAFFGRVPDYLTKNNNESLRFVVAAPQSYVYATSKRPAIDRDAFEKPKADKCPGWDDYPYGIKALGGYIRWTTGDIARQSYIAQHVDYIVGSEAQQTTDASCAAILQGSDVHVRAKSYHQYLDKLFPDDRANHKFHFLTGLANSEQALWSSRCASSLLFTEDGCAEPKELPEQAQ